VDVGAYSKNWDSNILKHLTWLNLSSEQSSEATGVPYAGEGFAVNFLYSKEMIWC
jgi:hypothetical protein